MSNNTIIMGWDAAWTPQGSGAWCVVRAERGKHQLLRWETTPRGAEAMKQRLQNVLQTYNPDLIAMDMPIATTKISGYREADRETTRAFSRYGCPVHSPTPTRPGAWGEICLEVARSYGFQVLTGNGKSSRSIAEVYPHTAILEMLQLSYRFPYKVTRARTFWPALSPEEARGRCLNHLKILFDRLGTDIALPDWEDIRPPLRPLAELKAFEDKIDALVCAWAGFHIHSRHFIPYGNEEAAIWNPDLNQLIPPRRPLGKLG